MAKHVNELPSLKPSAFGNWVHLGERSRDENGRYPNSLVLARRDRGGLEPYRLCLPHQIYEKDLPPVGVELYALPIYGDFSSWILVR